MDPNLRLAILVMDAYNRGGAGLNVTSNTIGSAQVLGNSVQAGIPEAGTSFFGIPGTRHKLAPRPSLIFIRRRAAQGLRAHARPPRRRR